MNDTIYRGDAIDAHCELCSNKYICCPVRNGNICPEFEVFQLLPSAQPTQTNAQPTQTNAQPTQNNALERFKGFPIDADLLMIKVLKEYGIMAHDRLYHIIETMDKYEIPSARPDDRLKKIADLLEGTIDHFDRDDAMDLLYQIKEVLND